MKQQGANDYLIDESAKCLNKMVHCERNATYFENQHDKTQEAYIKI